MAFKSKAAAGKAIWEALRASGRQRPVGELLRAAPRWIRDVLTGRYPHMTRGRLGLFAGAVAYIVSPIDFVPEFVPILGLGDDLFVVTWLVRSVIGELEAYLAWELQSSAAADVVQGSVVNEESPTARR